MLQRVVVAAAAVKVTAAAQDGAVRQIHPQVLTQITLGATPSTRRDTDIGGGLPQRHGVLRHLAHLTVPRLHVLAARRRVSGEQRFDRCRHPLPYGWGHQRQRFPGNGHVVRQDDDLHLLLQLKGVTVHLEAPLHTDGQSSGFLLRGVPSSTAPIVRLRFAGTFEVQERTLPSLEVMPLHKLLAKTQEGVHADVQTTLRLRAAVGEGALLAVDALPGPRHPDPGHGGGEQRLGHRCVAVSRRGRRGPCVPCTLR